MTTLLAWVAFPLGIAILSTAVGMLVERAARVRLPDGLVPAVGACAIVLLTLPVYVLGAGALPAAVILLVAAVAGAVLGRRRAWGAAPWAPLLAAVAAYGLYLAPVLLSGHWTWSGYNFVNDTSVNFVMVDHVMGDGDTPVAAGYSTAHNIVSGTLGANYPLGAHALLGTLAWLMPIGLPAVYQPFIAVLAGLAAASLTELARRVRVPSLAAVAIAVVAVGANITFQYALHGAFKEIAIVTVLAAAAAAARVALDEELRPGPVAVVAVCVAAAVAILSGAAGAYALVLGGLILVAGLLLEPRRPPAKRLAVSAGVAAAVLLVTLSPYLRDAVRFGAGASDVYSSTASLTGDNSTAVLGHLLRPLPWYQGLGTWLRDDYRYPLSPGTNDLRVSVAAMVVTGGLALGAVVVETVRRRWAAVLAVVPVALVYVIAEPRLSPYAAAKLLVIASPTVVFAAGLAAWWLVRRFWPAGLAAAAIVAGGVVLSDAMAYHYTTLAPTDRMEALEDAADRARGGPWLYTEWEEFAKYFGRDVQINVSPEAASPRAAELQVLGPINGRSIDVDELTLPYMQAWTGVIVRKGPTASRPPADFRLAYENEYYELWRKQPRPLILEHMSLRAGQDRSGEPRCADVRALAARTQPGERLVAARAPATPALDVLRLPDRPAGWNPTFVPDVVVPAQPGRAQGTVTTPAGRFRVWVRATTGRPLTVGVDGRRVGSVQQVNAPQQSLLAGTVTLGAGPHEVSLTREGGNLEPGDGFRGEIGRIVFEPVVEERLETVAPSRARSLCGREWDWIERVSP